MPESNPLSRFRPTRALLDPNRIAALTDIAKQEPNSVAQRAAQFFPRPGQAALDIPPADVPPTNVPPTNVPPRGTTPDEILALIDDFLEQLGLTGQLPPGILGYIRQSLTRAVASPVPPNPLAQYSPANSPAVPVTPPVNEFLPPRDAFLDYMMPEGSYVIRPPSSLVNETPPTYRF